MIVRSFAAWWEGSVGADCDWCASFEEDGCYHCKQKQLVANVAVAWAFDVGYFGSETAA